MNERDRAERTERDEPTRPASTRISRAWMAAFVGMVTLLIAAVFIAQNGDDVAVEFLAWEWTISLGLALLLAAVLGGLIVFSLGAARMVQLRRELRRPQAAPHPEPAPTEEPERAPERAPEPAPEHERG